MLSRSPEDTLQTAAALGSLLRGGEVVALIGELGSGKTVFTRGILVGLGFPARLVNSPTYVLEQVYESQPRVRHYDAYRLQNAEELRALGFDEHCGCQDILVVEWADKVQDLLPVERIVVCLDITGGDPSTRLLRFRGTPAAFGEALRVRMKNE